MDGWSGAGQRDYHYSMYNKRKFEEVHGIILDMLQIFSAIKLYTVTLFLQDFFKIKLIAFTACYVLIYYLYLRLKM